MAKTYVVICVIIANLADAVRRFEDGLEQLTESHSAKEQAAFEEGYNAGRGHFFPLATSHRFFPIPPSVGSPLLRSGYPVRQVFSVNPNSPNRASNDDDIRRSIENELQVLRRAQEDILQSYISLANLTFPLTGPSVDGISESIESESHGFRRAQAGIRRPYLKPHMTKDTTTFALDEVNDALPALEAFRIEVPMASMASVTPKDEEETVSKARKVHRVEKTFEMVKEGQVPDEEEEPRDKRTSNANERADIFTKITPEENEKEVVDRGVEQEDTKSSKVDEAEKVLGMVSRDEAGLQYLKGYEDKRTSAVNEIKEAWEAPVKTSDEETQLLHRPVQDRQIHIYEGALKRGSRFLREISADEAQQNRRDLNRQIKLAGKALSQASSILETILEYEVRLQDSKGLEDRERFEVNETREASEALGKTVEATAQLQYRRVLDAQIKIADEAFQRAFRILGIPKNEDGAHLLYSKGHEAKTRLEVEKEEDEGVWLTKSLDLTLESQMVDEAFLKQEEEDVASTTTTHRHPHRHPPPPPPTATHRHHPPPPPTATTHRHPPPPPIATTHRHHPPPPPTATTDQVSREETWITNSSDLLREFQMVDKAFLKKEKEDVAGENESKEDEQTFEVDEQEDSTDQISKEETWLANSFYLARESQMDDKAFLNQNEEDVADRKDKQEDANTSEADKKENVRRISADRTQQESKPVDKEAQKEALKRVLRAAHMVVQQQTQGKIGNAAQRRQI